jgi:hypothetical protein
VPIHGCLGTHDDDEDDNSESNLCTRSQLNISKVEVIDVSQRLAA